VRIEVAESADTLSHLVAEQFVRLTTGALRERGRCAVALSGGSTPKRVYRDLATESFRPRALWDQIDHRDSNYGMTAETLLSRVPVRAEKIHRVHGEIRDAALAAQEYETEIRTTCAEPVAIPRFDLVLLGLGADGHTASLFPGTAALDERRRLYVENWVPALNAYRITMTLPLINAARTVMFVVSGAEKAAMVRRVLRDGDAPAPLPSQRIRPTGGQLCWMLDRAAAEQLS
jgi:6-phosphogluconolactonase